MIKMKDVIKETCYTEAEQRLFKAVMRQIGDWQNVSSSPEDYRDASAGVCGFIYYYQTVKFAKKYLSDIVQVLTEFERELGAPLDTKPKDDDDDGTQLFNWLAWFALEHCIDKIIIYKEDNNL